MIWFSSEVGFLPMPASQIQVIVTTAHSNCSYWYLRCQWNDAWSVMSWNYNDAIMGAIASQITASRLFTQSFIQTQIKENIKAPRHWPLCGEFTGDRWIPHTNDQLRGKCFHLMTSSWNLKNLWRHSTGTEYHHSVHETNTITPISRLRRIHRY